MTVPTASTTGAGTKNRPILLAANQAAEDLYREAIDRLGRSGLGVEVARARLLSGEWLRRQRRRGEARDQLRARYEIFVSAGAGGLPNGPGPSSARLASAHPNAPRRPEML